MKFHPPLLRPFLSFCLLLTLYAEASAGCTLDYQYDSVDWSGIYGSQYLFQDYQYDPECPEVYGGGPNSICNVEIVVEYYCEGGNKISFYTWDGDGDNDCPPTYEPFQDCFYYGAYGPYYYEPCQCIVIEA